MGQRLLAIAVLTHQHRLPGRMEVRMVRRADDHRVDRLVHFVEHLAEVVILLSLFKALKVGAGPFLIHITNGHDILARHPIDIRPALTADPNTSNIQLFIRRLGLGLRASAKPETGPQGGRRFKHLATVQITHEWIFCWVKGRKGLHTVIECRRSGKGTLRTWPFPVLEPLGVEEARTSVVRADALPKKPSFDRALLTP